MGGVSQRHPAVGTHVDHLILHTFILFFQEPHDAVLYQSQREAVVRYISAECPEQLVALAKRHTISAILAQITMESRAIELNMTAEHELEESKKYCSRSNSGSDIYGEEESTSKIQWAENEARIRREEQQASERQLAAKEAEWVEREEKVRREERELMERQFTERESQRKEREAEIRREEREACEEERRQEDRRRGGGIKSLLRRIFGRIPVFVGRKKKERIRKKEKKKRGKGEKRRRELNHTKTTPYFFNFVFRDRPAQRLILE